MGNIEKIKPKDNMNETSAEELSFLHWKTELNKELLVFWRSMGE